jgi:hypothetical protein
MAKYGKKNFIHSISVGNVMTTIFPNQHTHTHTHTQIHTNTHTKDPLLEA